jgi:uncharacterized protein
MSTIQTLTQKKLIAPPSWLPGSVQYETMMGSVAYGVSSDTSDTDIYGFCMPPKELVFPHLGGEIPGFGTQIQRFEQFQIHHILDKDALGGKGREYDLQIFSIVKYFQLLMENNPNMIDSIFTPISCVLHSTQIGNLVRENRKIFLHKGAWHKFKGYAYSQIHKMEIKTPQKGSKRADLIEIFGFDIKFAYHVVRLVNEVEQILTEQDIDLQRNNEQLKAIRRGEWTPEQIKVFFTEKEKSLEAVYHTSTLPYKPDEPKIKQLLLECLEIHYGSLEKAVANPSHERDLLRQIKQLCEKAAL